MLCSGANFHNSYREGMEATRYKKKTIFFLYYYCGREGGFGITGALIGYFLGSYADWYGRKNL